MLTVFLALGRLADLAGRRADAPHAGGRDARLGHRARDGQDRDAHAEPDDRARAATAGRRPARIVGRRRATCPSRCHEIVEYSDPRQPGRPVRPDGHGVQAAGRALPRRHRAPARRLEPRARVPALGAAARAVARLALPDGDDYVIAAKGAPEAIADLCHLDAGTAATQVEATVSEMADEGLRVLGVARAHVPAATASFPRSSTTSTSSSWVWWASRTRSATTCPAAVAQAHARRHARRHDHRRLPRHGAGHRPGGGPAAPDAIMTGPELDADVGRRAGRQDRRDRHLRARRARAEAADRARAQGARRGRRHDGRRRQRRAGAQGRPHRHRHGPARHGRRARGRRARADRRRLLVDRRRRADGPPHLRQPAQGDGLHPRRPRAHRLHVASCRCCCGWPLVLMPIHIAFLELIIDPACSVVFEAEDEEGDVMDRPPRPVGAPMFSRRHGRHRPLAGSRGVRRRGGRVAATPRSVTCRRPTSARSRS